jgi:hypothetical protein
MCEISGGKARFLLFEQREHGACYQGRRFQREKGIDDYQRGSNTFGAVACARLSDCPHQALER